MANCRICGAESMRYESNGRFFTHPCKCGGVPRSKASNVQKLPPTAEIRKNVCRAIICRYCKEDAYYVEYNGGKVIFDSLGWPWPKHACFEYQQWLSKNENKPKSDLHACLSRTGNSSFGTISEFGFLDNSKFVTIDSVDCYEKSFKIIVRFSPDWFKGQLVIFSLSEKILIRPYIDFSHVVPIVSLIYSRQKECAPQSESPAISRVVEKSEKSSLECKYCKMFVFNNETSLDIHIWEKHLNNGGWGHKPDLECEECGICFLTKDGLLVHKKRRHSAS